jgi:hypothetical protein
MRAMKDAMRKMMRRLGYVDDDAAPQCTQVEEPLTEAEIVAAVIYLKTCQAALWSELEDPQSARQMREVNARELMYAGHVLLSAAATAGAGLRRESVQALHLQARTAISVACAAWLMDNGHNVSRVSPALAGHAAEALKCAREL